MPKFLTFSPADSISGFFFWVISWVIFIAARIFLSFGVTPYELRLPTITMLAAKLRLQRTRLNIEIFPH